MKYAKSYMKAINARVTWSPVRSLIMEDQLAAAMLSMWYGIVTFRCFPDHWDDRTVKSPSPGAARTHDRLPQQSSTAGATKY